jgi:membrane-associated protease RseP (regulator of RpoE activity)
MMTSWTQPQQRHETLPDEIEHIKGIVGRYFPIYNVQVHFDTISLFCNIDKDTLEEKFDTLRIEMKGMAYVPILMYERGEHVIHVVRKPYMKFKSSWLNVVLLVATICTTILAGSVLWSWIFGDANLLSANNLANGALYFALPLMLILGVHELAHYYSAKRHGIAASLPFFIPIPPLFIVPIGTMGAFISIRDPIPNKKALLDIGASGPIAGLIIAIPVTIVGMMMATPAMPMPEPGTLQDAIMFTGDSLLFFSLGLFFPVVQDSMMHPMAFAGWVGLFVTALNLLPAGQLDGGHIARALLGDKARWASYGALGLMIGLGLFTAYSGWLLFALLIMILGMRHPPPLNDITGLDHRRKAFGLLTVAVLVICFVPIPFSVEIYEFQYLNDNGDMVLTDSLESVFGSVNEEYDFTVANTGNVDATINLTVSSDDASKATATIMLGDNDVNASENKSINVQKFRNQRLSLNIVRPQFATGQVNITTTGTYFHEDKNLGYLSFHLIVYLREPLVFNIDNTSVEFYNINTTVFNSTWNNDTLPLTVQNTGYYHAGLNISVMSDDTNLSVVQMYPGNETVNTSTAFAVELSTGDAVDFTLDYRVPPNITGNVTFTVECVYIVNNEEVFSKTLYIFLELKPLI